MSGFELAQLNIARLRAPLDSPELADFVENLDRINALAERSPGFVWRLTGDGNDATALRPMGNDVIVNMSTWKDVTSLHDYVYKSVHVDVMRRRKEWFERIEDVYTVLWWVPAGHRPTIEQASSKLELVRLNGPTADAFTFKKPFPAPGAQPDAQIAGFEDLCPAS